jgi:CDP-4-dehydro-6-deoxyglucose reductase, E3
VGRTGVVHEAVQFEYPYMSRYEVYARGNPLLIDAARNPFSAECPLQIERFFSDAFVAAGPVYGALSAVDV